MKEGISRQHRRAGRVGPFLAVLVLVGIALSGRVSAQQAVRPEIEPGQVQKRILAPGAPERPPAPLIVPTPRPSVPSGEVQFVLAGVVIEGATALDAKELSAAYADDLARKIDLGDVEQILQRITAAYRAHGYFLSRAIATPQSLDDGVLRITVIEGYVERVTFAGAAPGEGDRLSPFVADVMAERPLRLATLERAILLIGDLPGLHVAPSLRPIDEAAGRYELVLTLDHQRFGGFASLDNRGLESIGPWQAQIGGSANSVLQAFDRLQLSVATVPDRPRELLSSELLYDMPLGSSGTRLALDVARTEIRPGGQLASLAIEGSAMRYTARLSYPLLRARAQSLWLNGSFDALASKENALGTQLFDDQLRVVRGGANYAATDALGGANFASAEASQGLGILGASPSGAANLSRSNGKAVFTKFTAGAVRDQILSVHWTVQLALAGQKALQPLLLSEQFALGGARFGRAYDPAEITGDDGLAGSVELRYGRSVPSDILRSYQIYAFYDLGAVWNMAVSDATQQQSLASLGGGIRLAFAHGIAAGLEIARPLTRHVAAEGGKPVRVFFSLSASF